MPHPVDSESCNSTENSTAFPISILVVDDEMLIRWSLMRTFEKEGIYTEIAADAEEGLEKVRQKRFTFALVDFRMPGRDGFALAEDIRRYSPQTRVILMTAHSTAEIEQRAVSMGIEYHAKPLALKHIMEILR